MAEASTRDDLRGPHRSGSSHARMRRRSRMPTTARSICRGSTQTRRTATPQVAGRWDAACRPLKPAPGRTRCRAQHRWYDGPGRTHPAARQPPGLPGTVTRLRSRSALQRDQCTGRAGIRAPSCAARTRWTVSSGRSATRACADRRDLVCRFFRRPRQLAYPSVPGREAFKR
jgi:hypothetical protein